MEVLIAVLACLLAILLLVTLAAFVSRITEVLESIGTGGSSSLEKITWGVRAIEVETSHIPVQVTALNARLGEVAHTLQQIDGGLQAIAEAAGNQRRYRD